MASMRLPGFEIRECLYEGQSTVVYAGVRSSDDAAVVAKLVTGGLRDLRHEASLLARVGGDGVVEGLGIFDSAQGPVLVQRRFGDATVADLVRHGPASLGVAVRVTAQLARVLARLHRAGVLHRDIKPSNVLYDSNTGKIALADFGVAVELPVGERSLRCHDLVGTPAYVSPEQTGRTREACDARSDLYSTGVMFYELLTGTSPFDMPDVLEQVAAQLSKTPVAPDAVNPAVPRTLSAVALKLMAKAADQRYQSAKGLAVDLERCLKAFEAQQPVPELELGRADVIRPRYPRQLFGRAAALGALREAQARAATGRPQCVLLSGPAGSGRSALLRQLAEDGPRVCSAIGDFVEDDQRPLAGLSRALTRLAEQALLLEDSELEAWRSRVLAAVGGVGQAVVDIAPALGDVLGPQPELPALGPGQSRARLQHAFRCFLGALAGAQPFLLALEDVERADPASLDLIDAACAATEGVALLIVLTAEQSAAFGQRAQQPEATRITLEPMSEPEVIAWVAATFAAPEQAVAPLGRVLAEKSGGNAGLLVRLIDHFLDLGVIDREDGVYCWDLERVRAAQAPQSLGSLLAQRVALLPDTLRAALSALAICEEEVEAETLAAVLAEPVDVVRERLSSLERDGLVASKAGRFAILHRGVARAASDVCEGDKRQLYTRLARHLLGTRSDAQLAETPYLVANALDRGALMLDSDERVRAAQLYVRAGTKAAAAMAYAQAVGYFERGWQLLGEAGAARAPEPSLALRVGQARALMMLGQVERCEQLLAALCEGELDPEALALVYQSRIDNMSIAMERDRAVKIGLEGLARLGVNVPFEPQPNDPFVMVKHNEARLSQLSQQEIVDYKLATDPRIIAAIKVLSSVTPAASAAGRSTLNLLCAEVGIQLALEHGRERYTASFLVAHAMVIGGALKNYAAARRYCEAALALETAWPAPEVGARTYLVVGYFLSAWFDPPATALGWLDKGVQLGREAGDLSFASLAASAGLTMLMMEGAALERVLQVIERQTGVLKGDGGAWANAHNVQHLCGRLTRGEEVLPQDLERVTAVPRSAGSMRNNAMVNLGLALSVSGHEPQVRAWLAEIGPTFPKINFGQPHVASLRLLEGLFAASDAQQGDAARASDAAKALQALQEIEQQTGASHHRPAILLLEAELARSAGDFELASGRYGRAVAEARARDMLHLIAVGHDRRAQMLQAQDMPDEAALHLREAYIAYKRWGHLTRAHQLEAAYPELRTLTGAARAPGATRGPSTLGGGGTSTINDSLDLASVLRISQTISTQLNPADVVESVLRGVTQSAGAERVVFVLRDGAGVETVFGELEAGQYSALQQPLTEYGLLPESVLRVTRRTRQPLVVADAVAEPTHGSDPFVREHGCRSIACIPVIRKGELSGFVLLENRLIVGAFTPQLLELTRALIAQAAISLDNALLYADMEARVRDRTAALAARNQQMRVVLDNVAQGLLVADRDGNFGSEHSAIVERWFGSQVPVHVRELFADDDQQALSFQLGWEQLFEGFLPVALCVDQLPRELVRDGRTLKLTWQPLTDANGALSAVLLVMSDVTELRRREQAELAQRQLMAVFEKVLSDRDGVTEFLGESDRLLSELVAGARPELEKRLLHTLKGNSAIFGLSDISAQCHALENLIEQEGRALTPAERAALEQRWREMRGQIERFLQSGARALQVSRADYEASLRWLQQEHHPLARLLELWTLESARARFERIAEQARQLAKRLNKAPLRVEIDDGGVYFVDRAWGPFWAAFVHVVRNAIDHGLESPDERQAAGKGVGCLSLRAHVSAEGFVLEVGDDGRGVDWERLRARAARAGLPSDSHDDLVAAMFSDGISTRESADETSGRGIGMAALRDVCTHMGARISLRSQTGVGTTFSLVFPLELVRCRGELPAPLEATA